ncbi:MAG: YbjN domain-containing protein [Pseudomonadota bacterium]
MPGICKAVAAVLSLVVTISGASAQSTSNSTLSKNRVLETISAADVTALLAELSITTALSENDPGLPPFMVATTAGGATFFVNFDGCTDVAAAAGCILVGHFTAGANLGLSYDDLNEFNTLAQVTRAVNDTQNNLVLFAHQQIISGGVGSDNYRLNLVLFLQDMQAHADRRQGAVTSVSFEQAAGAASSKILSGEPGAAATPEAISTAMSHRLVETAIDNNWTTDYTAGVPAALKE